MRYACFLLLVPFALLAAPPEDAAPKLPEGTDTARKQMAGFRLPPGMKVELFAAEPKLASPVAIGLDEQGRVYVAEEHRFNAGTEENRTRAFLLEDDLQVRTLDDRLKMFQKYESKFDGGMGWFTKHADQLRLLEDTTGSGRADKSTILAQFKEPLDGLAAGVMAIDGDVYITCVPHLWVLKKGETKPTKLLTGFGVNAAFLGHDLHGLCRGPDGKLYFSIGDRGFHVQTKEGTILSGPRTGAVFRCNLDGTELEVVHRGLRNPQELAFDQYGNLFADDNNCDKGDHARLVQIVEGGESGWNMAYQTIPAPYMSGPWFAERLWHLQHEGQPAYIVPPVGAIGAGPGGFLFTSGTSLADRYANSFLMCNYTGNGGLESFKVKPKGAGFAIDDYHDFLKPIMATDAEFGTDGKLYISDFVNLDWSGKSLGGRIYTVFDPKKIDGDTVRETKKLFAEGFAIRRTDDLIDFLAHADQRVRLRAQYELMNRVNGPDPKRASAVSGKLTAAALGHKDRFARLHALWAHAVVLKRTPKSADKLDAFEREPDAELRAQYAKVLGDAGAKKADVLLKLLNDANARVAFFAAQSLGKLKARDAIEPLFEVIRRNKYADAYLRHACVVALERIGDADAVAAKATDDSLSVRLAVVLVQRRLKDKRIATALEDADWFIRAEAARAIHDVPMDDLMPRLAAMLPKFGDKPIPDGDALVRRCVSAAYRLGGADEVKTVLAVVTNENYSSAVRADALGALSDWADPPQRDRVTGFWRPLPKRDAAPVRAAFEANLSDLLKKTDGALQTAVIATIQKLGVRADEAQFSTWANDAKAEPNLRVASLRYLASRKAMGLDAILTAALADTNPALRAEARERIAMLDAARGARLIGDVLSGTSSTTIERQRAIALLPRLKAPRASELLDAWGAKLAAGTVPAELKLDVLEALAAAPSATRDTNRAKFEKAQSDKFGASLVGGDAEKGRELFFNHTAAQCVRCHTISGSGGTAGPELTKVAEKYKENGREHFLESMLKPNAKIAEGFASVTISTLDGAVIAGVIVKEDAKGLTIRKPEGGTIVVAKGDIESRTTPTSPMPSVERTLSPRDVRDLVAYLSTLK